MFEPSEIGPLCKKLRQSKGLSLRDVSGNFLSTSFLSKFERGASDISVSRFFQLLDCMDVTIEEFYYLLSRDYIPSTERLIAKVGAAFRQHNILALKKYYREEKKRYEETRNKRHLYNMIMIESFIVKETDGDISPEHIATITDYLFQVEFWGRRELMIYGNAMPAISSETLNLLTREIIFKASLYTVGERTLQIRIQALLNTVNEFLARGKNNLALENIKHIESLGIPEEFFYERHVYQFLWAQLLYKQGKQERALEKIEAGLTCLRYLGCKNMLLPVEELYEKYCDEFEEGN